MQSFNVNPESTKYADRPYIFIYLIFWHPCGAKGHSLPSKVSIVSSWTQRHCVGVRSRSLQRCVCVCAYYVYLKSLEKGLSVGRCNLCIVEKLEKELSMSVVFGRQLIHLSFSNVWKTNLEGERRERERAKWSRDETVQIMIYIPCNGLVKLK